MSFLQILMALLILGVILVPIFFAGFILRLLDKAAKARQRPVRYYLVDFFSLVFLIQIPFALILQMPNRDNFAAALVAGFFGLMMALVWWTTIKTVSRAGIVRVADRSWISLLVIPMMYVGSFAIVGIAITLLRGPKGFQVQWVVVEICSACLDALFSAGDQAYRQSRGSRG